MDQRLWTSKARAELDEPVLQRGFVDGGVDRTHGDITNRTVTSYPAGRWLSTRPGDVV